MWSGGRSETTYVKVVGNMERMEDSKMTRRVYVSEAEGGNVRG